MDIAWRVTIATKEEEVVRFLVIIVRESQSRETNLNVGGQGHVN